MAFEQQEETKEQQIETHKDINEGRFKNSEKNTVEYVLVLSWYAIFYIFGIWVLYWKLYELELWYCYEINDVWIMNVVGMLVDDVMGE